MTAPADKVDEAVRLVQGAWTPLRAGEGEQRLLGRLDRRARRRRTMAVGGFGLLVGVAGLGLVLWGRAWLEPGKIARAPYPETDRWTFADGSTAEPTVGDTDLRVVERAERRHVVRILRGGARFDVVRRDTRLFRVEMRDVVVEVLGTCFRV